MKKKTTHILVVDDETLVEYMILQKFRREIRSELYHFQFALNGQQALEALHANTAIDMVLTDIRMPEMDGLTLIEKLRDFNRDIKTVVVSAYGDLRNIRMAMNRGAFDFLTKPIDLDDLNITIQKTIDHIVQDRQEQEQLRQAQEQLRYFAFHDVLTNLTNRSWLMRRLEQAIALHQRKPDHHYVVILLDIDRFKDINDSHGHAVGDYLLISVASRLQDCLRISDTIARLGGDEFAILIEGIRDSEMMQIIQRIQLSLSDPYHIGEHVFHTRASFGITTSDVGYTQAGKIIQDTEVAMYRAKRDGEGYALFDPSMHAQLTERLQLEQAIRHAIEHHEFQNFYQPLVDLRTGALIGFEALARWHRPGHGWVAPAQFVPIAEDTGLIHALGRQLFEKACADLQHWQQAFPACQLQIHSNVSAIQLRSASFASELVVMLHKYQLHPDVIKLELTESTLIDDTQVDYKQILQLLDLGFNLCIDDFGTGYSSLSRLHAFPITTLKIDQSFVRQMVASQPHLATVKIILALADMLAMNVVAEGIETSAERDLLIQMGCTTGQGYLIAAPLDTEAATAYIAAQSTLFNDS